MARRTGASSTPPGAVRWNRATQRLVHLDRARHRAPRAPEIVPVVNPDPAVRALQLFHPTNTGQSLLCSTFSDEKAARAESFFTVAVFSGVRGRAVFGQCRAARKAECRCQASGSRALTLSSPWVTNRAELGIRDPGPGSRASHHADRGSRAGTGCGARLHRKATWYTVHFPPNVA
jgi:hypothetical protein